MKRASVSLSTYDLLAAKAQDEAIGAVIAYEKRGLAGKSEKSRPSRTTLQSRHFDQT